MYAADQCAQTFVTVFATAGMPSRYVPMSVASAEVMAFARMPHMVLPLDLYLPVVTTLATSPADQPMMPVASGVMLADWPIEVPDVIMRPPSNACAALMRVGVSFARSTVWQVTQTSVARYLPLAAPVALVNGGRSAGLTGAFCGALGWVAYAPVLSCGTFVEAGTVRR